MTAQSRVAAGLGLLTQLSEIVVRERGNGAAWYRYLLDMRTVLEMEDRPAKDRLDEAAEILDSMYKGPRNFTDFYLHRDDPHERVTANERFSALVAELSTQLHGGED